MNIHKRILMFVGLGTIIILAVVVLALLNVVTVFSGVTREMASVSEELQLVMQIEKVLDTQSRDLHQYVGDGDPKHLESYRSSAEALRPLFDNIVKQPGSKADAQFIGLLKNDLAVLDQRARQIAALRRVTGTDRGIARNLALEIDELLEWTNKNIERHYREQLLKIGAFGKSVRSLEMRVLAFFLLLCALVTGLLLGLGWYLHRKVAVPLNDLWKGATQISRGDLDYQMRFAGTSDIGQLAERFNEMARQLRRSYSELEKKLLDRTNELAAIDSVALTLGQSGNLRDMLSKSLSQILDSLAGLDPKGGIFLCEPDNGLLHLVAFQGLSEEFIRNEATIRMGECLCGLAAQTGEILYSEKGCDDPRHARSRDGADHSHIIIPIKSRGIVLGVIFLYPQKDFALKPSDLQMLDTIGTQLGLAVENLRFYAEVKESSEKFWDLFENSHDILFTMDPAGTLTAVNKAAEKFSGYAKTELVGKSVLDFLTPENAETAKRLLADEGPPKREITEFEVVKQDKGRAVIELSARKIVKNRVHAGFQVSARDITEQKQLREKLLAAERIGAIGQIVITVRHEINNPLTTVIGNVELLLERYGEKDTDLRMRLESVLNNSLRIAEIVQKLQAIKRDKVVEYVKGVSMTDLKQE